MPSRRSTSTSAHKWTNFEKHTLLCLMAKNMHLEERGNHKEEEGVMRQHAYLNVATALNEAVNGKNGGFGNDIDKKEVAKMIDKMLVEKKGVVGKGGYMERATRGRITRGLRKMWHREPSFDYDGSLSECNHWRKADEEAKRSFAGGSAPEEAAAAVVEPNAPGLAPEILESIWRQAATAPSAVPNPAAPFSNQTATRTPAAPPIGARDTFNRLPAHVRGNVKYAWAGPAHRAVLARAKSNVDCYHPSYNSSRPAGPTTSDSSSRYEPETYRPPAIGPMPTPSLTHDDSSSTDKDFSYSGTARPTLSLNNSNEEADLGRAIQPEISQRRSLPLKRPGILKRQSNVSNSGDSALRDMINPARKALFAQPDVEVENIVENKSGRPVGTKANSEEMPFNRFEQRHDSGS